SQNARGYLRDQCIQLRERSGFQNRQNALSRAFTDARLRTKLLHRSICSREGELIYLERSGSHRFSPKWIFVKQLHELAIQFKDFGYRFIFHAKLRLTFDRVFILQVRSFVFVDNKTDTTVFCEKLNGPIDKSYQFI